MARKKSTDEVVPEVTGVVIEESVVEEKPKATKKKKVAEKVEEPVVAVIPEVVEEPIVEIPVEPEKVEEVPVVAEVPIVEEKPKRVKKVKAEKVEDPAPVEKVDEVVSDFPYKAKVVASVIHSRKGPGMAFHIARDLYKGTVVTVTEIDGNWGKIGKDLWVNINYIEKI